jgi:hypothetical protein
MEYPFGPEEMKKILEDCARINGLNIVFCKTYNEEIHVHLNEGDVMRDKYEAGQAGAQGPLAHAHDMTFNQIWDHAEENIDLRILAEELEKLRHELRNSATSPEDDAKIGAIASAELEAKKGDGPKALSALAKAGKWAFDAATQIGVQVAAEALKLALVASGTK